MKVFIIIIIFCFFFLFIFSLLLLFHEVSLFRGFSTNTLQPPIHHMLMQNLDSNPSRRKMFLSSKFPVINVLIRDQIICGCCTYFIQRHADCVICSCHIFVQTRPTLFCIFFFDMSSTKQNLHDVFLHQIKFRLKSLLSKRYLLGILSSQTWKTSVSLAENAER